MDQKGTPVLSFDYKVALRTAFIVTVAAIAGLAVHADDPWWAGISAFTVAHADWSGVFSKSFQRLLGTITGGVLGFMVAYAVRNEPLLQAAVLFALGALATYKHLTTSYGYAWLLGIATALIAMYFSLWDIEQMYERVLDRIFCVCIGVLVAGLGTYLLALPKHFRTSTVMVHGDPKTLPYKWIIRMSLCGGSVAVTAPIVFAGHDLTAMMQIVFTSLVCLSGNITSIRHLAAARFLGCGVGGSLGIFFVMLGIQSFFLWAILFFFAMFFLAGWHHNGTRWAYAGTQAGFAFIICAMTTSGPVASILPVLDRFYGIFIGIILTLVYLALFGIAQGEKLSWLVRREDRFNEK
ncbi:FUSC family protein [Flexibacterium corallicola]|uniref:FUSC family protein n=1 Tax=Flexibacterium corallicola TaxID=3037259 RepID=UPI00286F67C3|nr:FUSC family protein [Pseudovibrio sp. M1P-2-3]